MATLLLADDSFSMARTVEQALATDEVRVVAALSGERALATLESDPPAIVLADIGMARVNGYDIASYIKNSPALAHIPVLLLTGPFERINEEKARATGCDGVVVKPIEPRLLSALVRALLAGVRVDPVLLWPSNLPRVESWDAPSAVTESPETASDDASFGWKASRRGLDEPSSQMFDAGLDQLDAAFASNGPAPAFLNPSAAAEFASDLSVLRGSFHDGPRRRKSDRAAAPLATRAAVAATQPVFSPATAWIPQPAGVEKTDKADKPVDPQIKIKLKIGAVEFEAEGPAELVQAQLEDFKRLAGAAPAPTPRVRSLSQHVASSRRRRSGASAELASSGN
jgi:CheY-like chemotaxis protein